MNALNSEKKIIAVIGDSLGAPRPWVGVSLKSTYAYQLSTLLGSEFYVVNYSASDNSSSHFIKESFLRTYISKADIAYAIIQVGIVDCAPRLLSNFDRLIGGLSSRVVFLSYLFKKYIALKSRHRHWITKNFPRTLVPLPEYEKNYQRLIDELINTNPIKKIFLIEIAYPGNWLRDRSFNIVNNVNEYNDAIHRIALNNSKLIDVVKFNEQSRINSGWVVPQDGHHILPDAHDWIARNIYSRIK